MGTLTLNNNSRRAWLLLAALVLVIAVVAAVGLLWERPGALAPAGQDAQSPQALWEAQDLDSYRYTLQVGCFCITEMTQPVVIEVHDGAVGSVTYAADGSAADATLFAAYDSVEDLFAVIAGAEAQNAARLDVTYAEETGVPLSIDIDIDEMMADEELVLTVTSFEALD